MDSNAPALPIIDLTNLALNDPTETAKITESIRQACQDKGFFYITGHGIETSLQTEVFDQAKHFFAQPESQKLAISTQQSKANRGYEPIKHQTLEANGLPDLKEGFYIGIDHPEDHPMVKAGRFNYGPNQWPQNMPAFQQATSQYLQQLTELATKIMSLLALSLELEADYFSEFCQDPLVTLRLLHYPPQPATSHPDEKGCGAHTDFGGITLLLQDENGGLEVWDHDHQQWLAAPPIAGSYIVNLGDMIARWTNDKYQSTRHRVINKSGKERYSIPFFFSGHPDHKVACLESCLTPSEQAKYPPVTVEEHMREMYRRTYL